MFRSKKSTPTLPRIVNISSLIDEKEGVHVSNMFGDNPPINLLGGSTGIYDLINASALSHGKNPCLGTHSSLNEPYKWETYAEMFERTKNVGSGLLHLFGLVPGKGNCVGIFSINCPEWLICSYACASYNLICVPLYDALEAIALKHICNQAELSVLFCDSVARAKLLLSISAEIPSLKHIVIFKPSSDIESLQLTSSVGLVCFKQVIDAGKQNPYEPIPSRGEELVFICYTSGTTGLPKGVMIPNRMMLASLNSNIVNAGSEVISESDIHISYLPLAHIFEQMIVLLMIFGKARIGFFSGDVRNLSKDAIMLKPTIFVAVPRVLSRIYEGVQEKIGSSYIKQRIFNVAFNAKTRYTDRNIFSKETMWDALVFSKIRNQLGGEVKLIICGGAHLPSHILKFIRAVFSCPVCDGYGSTETCSAFTIAMNSDLEGGHVGAPVPGMQLKLVNIDEMNIVSSRDNKGEICCKGPCCTPGYFKDPEKTAELIDSNGWLHTGDVGIWTEKGSLKIVERCKHIFKLSQGEYVSPEKVELVYQMSQFVVQVFVDGDTCQRYPVAIILPNFEKLIQALNCKRSSTNGQTKSSIALPIKTIVPPSGEQEDTFLVKGNRVTLMEICEMPEASKIILADLNKLGKERNLNGFEQVRSIGLIRSPFTIENRMMTPTMKYARAIIRNIYSSKIQSLYCSSL